MSNQPYLTPKYVTRTINDNTIRFYACSLGCAFKLKDLAKPIVSAMATLLLEGGETDQGLMKNEALDSEGALNTTTAYQPISPELATLRHDQRATTIDSVVDALLQPSSKMILCEIIADSMREDFKRGSDGYVMESDVRALAQQLDMPTFIEMLKGVGQANASVFGPLAQRLSLAVKKVGESQFGNQQGPVKKSPTADENSQSSKSPEIPG